MVGMLRDFCVVAQERSTGTVSLYIADRIHRIMAGLRPGAGGAAKGKKSATGGGSEPAASAGVATAPSAAAARAGKPADDDFEYACVWTVCSSPFSVGWL